MRLRPLMIGIIALSCVVLLAGKSPVSAQVASTSVSAHQDCVEDEAGFTAALQPIPPGAGQAPIRVTAASTTSVLAFDLGNGTFTRQGQSSSIRSDLKIFVDSSFTCNGTWTFNPADSTLHLSSACNFTEMFPVAGTGTVTGIQDVFKVTFPPSGGTVLVHAGPYPPAVETVTPTGGTPIFRVCMATSEAHF